MEVTEIGTVSAEVGFGTAEVALIISAFALAVGLGNFIWNVWSKFIQPKPRIKIHFAVMLRVGQHDFPGPERAIQISATNFGPNDVVITGVEGLSRRFNWFRYTTTNFVIFGSTAWPTGHTGPPPDYGNFPFRIKVGDKAQWYMPMDNRYFGESEMTHFGLADSFGRTHWAKRAQVATVRKSVLEHLQQSADDIEKPKE